MTADPIKLDGGLNSYSYVGGNPVSWIDPLGLFNQDITGFDNMPVNTSEPTWSGSGPTEGVLGLEPGSRSSRAVQNYYPSPHPRDGRMVEYVYDPKTDTFAVGRPKDGTPWYSPHEKLSETIDSDRSEILGGMFKRGKNGEFFTDEHSGHYGDRWTPELRIKFIDKMKEYGIDVKHQEWGQ